MADITVVVPVRDDIRVIRCLESIDDICAKPLVVMNGPTKAVREAIEACGCNSITLPSECGGPAACEIGIRESDTDAVLMMDSDCVFLPGTINKFHAALGTADFVRGTTLFRHRSRSERIVAKTRARHTNAPGRLHKVPLMMDRNVASRIGGYIFDRRLQWTEDHDLTVRAKKANVDVRTIRTAVVLHDRLTMRRDLLSAYRYGKGHRLGVEMGLCGYGRVTWRKELRLPRTVVDRCGVTESLYGLVFNAVFTYGYKTGRAVKDL